MRYNSFRSPGLSAASGGLFEDDLVLKPPPYKPGETDDEDALRLAPAPTRRSSPLPDPPASPRRRRKGVPLPLLMAGWAAVLGAALGVAYIAQPVRQLDGQADLPAAPPPPTDAALGTPVTAPSIASQPAQFASAAPANAAAQPDQPQLSIAEAPNPPPLEVKPAPPDPPEPPAVQTAAEAPKPAALKVEKAAEPAKPSARTDKALPPAKPKAAKLETASTDAPAARPDKPSAKGAAAQAKDLPLLKARLNRAYAEAVKAGTPKAVLKARQAEWAVLRARAEKKGPAAVSALYRARAAQLEAIARKSGHVRSKA